MAEAKYASSRWIKGILRAEMAKKGMTYADLAKCLQASLVDEDEKNLANKIGRGNLSAILFMQCLSAMGLRNLDFEPWHEYICATQDEKIEIREVHQMYLAELTGGVSEKPAGTRSRKRKARG